METRSGRNLETGIPAHQPDEHYPTTIISRFDQRALDNISNALRDNNLRISLNILQETYPQHVTRQYFLEKTNSLVYGKEDYDNVRRSAKLGRRRPT